MTAQIIDGKAFAAKVRAQVAQHVAQMKQAHGITPGWLWFWWGKILPAKCMCARRASRR